MKSEDDIKKDTQGCGDSAPLFPESSPHIDYIAPRSLSKREVSKQLIDVLPLKGQEIVGKNKALRKRAVGKKKFKPQLNGDDLPLPTDLLNGRSSVGSLDFIGYIEGEIGQGVYAVKLQEEAKSVSCSSQSAQQDGDRVLVRKSEDGRYHIIASLFDDWTPEKGALRILSLLPSIGAVTAKKISDLLGGDSLASLADFESAKEKLKHLHLPEEALTALSEIGRCRTRDLQILMAWGFGRANALRILSAFNGLPPDPYMPAVIAIPYIGFKTVDKVGLGLGFPKSHPTRVEAGVICALNNHIRATCDSSVPLKTLVDKTAKLLGVPKVFIEGEIRRSPSICVSNVFHEVVYPRWLLRVEMDVAKILLALTNKTCTPKTEETAESFVPSIRQTGKGVSLSSTQKQAVLLAERSHISLLLGAAGTGKTTTLREIVCRALDRGEKVIGLAPYGKSADRASEVVGEIRFQTIHKGLEYSPRNGWGKNEENPLDADLIIIDEAETLDLNVARRLLKSVGNARILFCGDPEQLPSIGAGNFLSDLAVCCRIPVSRLNEVHRYAGASAHLAHIVAYGKYKDLRTFVSSLKGQTTNFKYELCAHDKVVNRAIFWSEKYRKEKGVSAVILVQRAADVDAINCALAKRFPSPGDKVICYQTWTSDSITIPNGVVGEIVGPDLLGDGVFCKFHTISENPISIPSKLMWDTENRNRSFRPACAMTVHKALGSEFEITIVIVKRFSRELLTRNLVYTSITRHKKGMILLDTKPEEGQDGDYQMTAIELAMSREKENLSRRSYLWTRILTSSVEDVDVSLDTETTNSAAAKNHDTEEAEATKYED